MAKCIQHKELDTIERMPDRQAQQMVAGGQWGWCSKAAWKNTKTKPGKPVQAGARLVIILVDSPK